MTVDPQEPSLGEIQRQLRDMQQTVDLLVNYMREVALKMGLQDQILKLDERLDGVRAGLVNEAEMTPAPETNRE